MGGVRQTSTESVMMQWGTGKASLEGREEGLVIPGVIDNGDGTYRPNDIRIDAFTWAQFVGGRNGFGELYNYSATNSRLRELSLGYTFNRPEKAFLKELQISLTGRNLFYFYNGCKWFDPDQSADVNINGQGAEISSLPGTRSFGINLKAVF
jgi:hypothetical protein